MQEAEEVKKNEPGKSFSSHIKTLMAWLQVGGPSAAHARTLTKSPSTRMIVGSMKSKI